MKVMQIWIMDDEREATDHVKFFLDKPGFEVITANAPSEAFDALNMHSVGILLCDSMLPQMTGIEVLTKVNKDYPDSVPYIKSGFLSTHYSGKAKAYINGHTAE